MAGLDLYSVEGKRVGSVPLPKVLGGEVNRPLLWQAVRQYRANQRQGTADTKMRGEVSGGGKKPWRQKHSGRARAGSSRSPLWRKGGVVFGPHPREYRYELPQRMRKNALVSSLRAKVTDQGMTVVQDLEALEPKTKALARFLKQVGAGEKTLVVVEKQAVGLARISRNLRKVFVRAASDLTCYDVLACQKLVLTAEALKQLDGLQG
jgi:large subunit ribosomal protein L4